MTEKNKKNDELESYGHDLTEKICKEQGWPIPERVDTNGSSFRNLK